MQEIIACVMNISEGRDISTLDAIAANIEKIDKSFLLHFCSDPAHHRAVFSFIGTPYSIASAAFAATTTAVELIDLTKHRGVHPRVGAVDVIPFVPIQGLSMKKCIQVAYQLAERIGQELEIPVYLYGEAATRPSSKNLSTIRAGEFERLGEQLDKDPNRKPDFGPPCMHPTAGAVVVGARQLMIAFNIYLESSDPTIARSIASRVRESGGGLPGIKALGFYITHLDRAQVSINVMDYRKTSLLKIFDRVCVEAHQLGTGVESSEIIGLVPQDALKEDVASAIQLKGFTPSQVLENNIRSTPLGSDIGHIEQ